MVDYEKCKPQACESGICLAVLACPHNTLSQEAPYEMPDPHSAMCVGCEICMPACPVKAIITV